MRTIVLYKSSAGSTKKYAEEIASAIHADCMDIKKAKIRKVREYDTIVFGGWVSLNKINGIDEFLSDYEEFKDKNVIVFAVGISIVNQAQRAALISSNLLDMYHIRFYVLQGSFDYEKLSMINRLKWNRIIGQLQSKGDITAGEQQIIDLVEHPYFYHDQAGVDRIVSVLHKLEATVPEA